MNKRLAALSILSLLFASVASAQQIYKWQDEKGQWHFQQGSSRGPVPVIRVTMEKLTYNQGTYELRELPRT